MHKTFQPLKNKENIQYEFTELLKNVSISQYKFYVGRFNFALKTVNNLDEFYNVYCP